MQRNAAEREENAARFELVGTVQGAPTTQRKTPMLDNATLGPDIVVECDVCAFRLLEKEARFWKTDPQFYVAKEQGVYFSAPGRIQPPTPRASSRRNGSFQSTEASPGRGTSPSPEQERLRARSCSRMPGVRDSNAMKALSRAHHSTGMSLSISLRQQGWVQSLSGASGIHLEIQIWASPRDATRDTKGQALATLEDLQEHDRGMAMERPYKGPILSAKALGENVPSVNRTWPKGTGSRRIKIDGIDE